MAKLRMKTVALVLLAGTILPAPGIMHNAAHAAGCYRSSCNGLFPAAQGCTADAQQLDQAAVGSYGTVYLKYSPTCDAAWAEYYFTSPYAYSFVEYKPGSSAYQSDYDSVSPAISRMGDASTGVGQKAFAEAHRSNGTIIVTGQTNYH